jgi:hypothetical protein
MPQLFTFISNNPLPFDVYNKRVSIIIVSYLFQILYSSLVYFYLLNAKKVSIAHSSFGFYFAFTTCHFAAMYAIDAISLFILFILFIVIEKNMFLLYSFIIFTSIIINEKIIFITLIFVVLKNKNLFSIPIKYIVTPIACMLCYLVMRRIFPVDGHESHLLLNTYLPSIIYNIKFIWFSPRGIILVLFPLIFSLLISYVSAITSYYSYRLIFFPFSLLMIGGFLDLSYSNGRFIAHTIPFFIVPFILSFIHNKSEEIVSNCPLEPKV